MKNKQEQLLVPLNIETMDYCDFMRGMCNAPWDNDKCDQCGGTGLIPAYCCSGTECGCRGMPIDFVECWCCDCAEPTNEQIRAWCGL